MAFAFSCVVVDNLYIYAKTIVLTTKAKVSLVEVEIGNCFGNDIKYRLKVSL